MIRRDRDGNEAPHSTIKTVVTSLVQANAFTDQPLQLYIEEFERPYLVHTKRYFEAESAREMAAGDISTFMKKAMTRLQQEIMRNNRYCHSCRLVLVTSRIGSIAPIVQLRSQSTHL